MAELKNEFRWSVTRYRHFLECSRLYYLSHYAFWGGWRLDADDHSRTCYRLTKMKNLDTWAGEIVHDTIEQALRDMLISYPVELDRLISRAIEMLRAGWKQSRDEEWRVDPKRRVNLFEHYYHREISRERTDEIKQRVIQCLKTFWSSGTFQFIRRVDPGQWKTLEQFQEFDLEGFPVTLKMDFALEHEGWLHIYDWKTGRRDDKDLIQLVCYALYAMKSWSYHADRIKIILAYLRDNDFVEHRPSPEEIIHAQDRILDGCNRLVSHLTDPEANLAAIENFPMTTDRRKCTRCFFWEVCYGTRIISD